MLFRCAEKCRRLKNRIWVVYSNMHADENLPKKNTLLRKQKPMHPRRTTNYSINEWWNQLWWNFRCMWLFPKTISVRPKKLNVSECKFILDEFIENKNRKTVVWNGVKLIFWQSWLNLHRFAWNEHGSEYIDICFDSFTIQKSSKLENYFF